MRLRATKLSAIGFSGSRAALPSLDLAFAADKTLTARKGPTPTFTRASTATFVGSDGLIQSAAINAPRFDHDPDTLACKGLLIEEARTNLSLQSGVIVNNSGWATLDATAAVSGTGPDGNNAYQISEAASSNFHALVNLGGTGAANATSVVSGVNYTGSIFAKKVAGSVDWVQLTFGFAGFGSVLFANFNISNGTIGNFNGLTAGTVPRIEQFPNGWYRISMTATAIATTASTGNAILAFTNNSDSLTRLPPYLGSISNQVLASLCQFELGSFPTSYIPTTTTALTRSADVCSITGGDFTSFYNQSEGTVSLQATSLMATATGGNRTFLSFTDGSYTNQQGIYKSANGANLNTPVGLAIGTAVGTITQGVAFKVTVALQPSNSAASFNGGAAATVSSATTVGINRLELRDPTGAPGGHPSCHIARIQYFRKRLPNAKLQSLTTP